MSQEAKFKCLRCGHEHMQPFDAEKEPQERACPKCKSNSVRPDKSGEAK